MGHKGTRHRLSLLCVCAIDVSEQSIVFAVFWGGFRSFLVAKLCVLSFVAVKAWLDLADLWFMSFSYLVISFSYTPYLSRIRNIFVCTLIIQGRHAYLVFYMNQKDIS